MTKIKSKTIKISELKKIEEEFFRIAQILVTNGDIDILCDMILPNTKKDFIESWKKED